MTRQFYYFAIFLFVILILQEILITTVLTSVGQGIYAFGSFMSYFMLISATQASCSVIAILYCYSHQYIWPFRAGWLCIITLTLHTAVVYEILVNQNLESWYDYSFCAMAAAHLLFGVSLVATKCREHFWLKWIGIAMICVDTAEIALLIWYNFFADLQMRAMLSQANFLLSWLMIATTGLWIMHFVSEVKAMKSLNTIPRMSLVSLILVSVIVSYFTVSLGSDFYEESKAPLPVQNVSAAVSCILNVFA